MLAPLPPCPSRWASGCRNGTSLDRQVVRSPSRLFAGYNPERRRPGIGGCRLRHVHRGISSSSRGGGSSGGPTEECPPPTAPELKVGIRDDAGCERTDLDLPSSLRASLSRGDSPAGDVRAAAETADRESLTTWGRLSSSSSVSEKLEGFVVPAEVRSWAIAAGSAAILALGSGRFDG